MCFLNLSEGASFFFHSVSFTVFVTASITKLSYLLQHNHHTAGATTYADTWHRIPRRISTFQLPSRRHFVDCKTGELSAEAFAHMYSDIKVKPSELELNFHTTLAGICGLGHVVLISKQSQQMGFLLFCREPQNTARSLGLVSPASSLGHKREKKEKHGPGSSTYI